MILQEITVAISHITAVDINPLKKKGLWISFSVDRVW